MPRFLTKKGKAKPLFNKEIESHEANQSSTSNDNNGCTTIKAINQSTPFPSKLKCKRKSSGSHRDRYKKQRVEEKNNTSILKDTRVNSSLNDDFFDTKSIDKNTIILKETHVNTHITEESNVNVIPNSVEEDLNNAILDQSFNEKEKDINISEVAFTLTNSINVTVDHINDNKTLDLVLSDLDLTETTNTNDLKKYPANSFYGLPMKVKELLKADRGIDKLYDWQDECLNLPAVLNNKNVIYSLPTSGGKTLVAELIILNELMNYKKNVLLVLPYVSIVQEKVRIMSPFAVEFGFNIEEYAASKGCIPPKKRRKNRSLYIATIEKGNGIVNSLIENNRIEELGLVVVDELHMIGDGGSRGAALEMLLAKILYKLSSIQIIGMSATLGNIDEVQEFLAAEIYTNNFRPVELKEFVKVSDSLYEVNPKAESEEDILKLHRTIAHSSILHKSIKSSDPDHIVSLVMEVIPESSCLVFCATKKHCENIAVLLAKYLPSHFKEINKESRCSLMNTIKQSANGICHILSKSIPFGVAYHHSGLTMDERKLIEEGYCDGTLKLLCCTSTLAAGVNLPAKRAILRSPYVGIAPISRSQYKQMIGRAGRAGLDQSGESILITSPKDKQKLLSILCGTIEKCTSSMVYENSKGVRQLILNLMGLNLCSNITELKKFIEGTLYFVQMKKHCENASEKLMESLETGIEALKVNGFITFGEEDKLVTTSLGNATYKAFLDLDFAPFIYTELKKSLNGIVLANELHLLYLATPMEPVESIKVNWMLYCNLFCKFSEADNIVADFVGIKESVLARKSCGQTSSKDKSSERVYIRFYITIILSCLMRKKTVWHVSNKFDVPRGFLQNLLASAVSLTSSLVHFTQEIQEFSSLKILFEDLLKKLNNTTDYELEELMEIPAVKKARARQLYKKGYKTLKDIAKANVKKLCEEIEYLPRNQANLIVSSAKMILKQKIESLLEEVDDMALSNND